MTESHDLKSWAAVDQYFSDTLLPGDPALEAALRDSDKAGLPPVQVSPLQGKLLQLLATIRGARRILEIGTLGGFSTLFLARALPPGGQLVTLEISPVHAAVARANLNRAGFGAEVEVRIGPALHSLAALEHEKAEPFDLIFIDADKPSNPAYLEASMRLVRPGSLIVADNVVRGGAVGSAGSHNASVLGIRRFCELVGRDPRLSATAIQTVGVKGYDGLLLAVVAPEA